MKIFELYDEKDSLSFLEKELMKIDNNIEISTFKDFDSLLLEFKNNPPDIVFLDEKMPEISGIIAAKKLQKIKTNINIIFATSYTKYALEACELYASGYVIKPFNKQSLLKVLKNLRYPLITKKDIYVRTFGNFDISYKGKSVVFRSPRSKEVLAYLIDRMGAKVNKKEIAAVIYEDDYSRNIQRTLSRNFQYLKEDLARSGIKNLFIVEKDGYRVDMSLIDCDLVNYLNGESSELFSDEYMEQYSWGEYRKYSLRNKSSNNY